MQLNDVGRIVEHQWLRTAEIRPNVFLGPWVIMPNHVHMIVTIRDSEEPRYRTVGAHCVRPDENESIVMLGNSFPSSHPISVD
ncbi:MAG TPA: hypothetical protein VN397_03345, partial [Candidatus Methylomirabilis sp.]|nr:hypothetical protein [Candidatus Methylomirabilis sp.]